MARKGNAKGSKPKEPVFTGPFTGPSAEPARSPPANEVLAATTEVKAFMHKRFRAWFGEKSTRFRTLFIIAVVIVLVLILQLLVQAGLSFQSLRNDDLVLFIQPGEESVTLPHGSNGTINFTLGTSNLNLCEASCSWNITDVATGRALAGGSDLFKDGDKRTYSVEVSSRQGEAHSPYQFTVACENRATGYCKSSASLRHNAAVTMVQSTYTPAEQVAHDALAKELPAWQVVASAEARSLAGVAVQDDQRLGSLPAEAADELVGLRARFASLSSALQRSDVLAGQKLLTPLDTTTVDTYAAFVGMEARLVSFYNFLRLREPEADAVLAIAAPKDRSALLAAGDAVTVSVSKFGSRSLGLTEDTFAAWNDSLTNLTSVYSPIALADAARAQQLLAEEQRAICTLKAGACPLPLIAPQNLSAAVDSLRAACVAYASLDDRFVLAQTAYEAELDPTATEAELFATYDVASLQADPGFPALAEAWRASARNGTLPTNTVPVGLALPIEQIRLGVLLNVSNETTAFFSARCPLSTAAAGLPSVPLKASLPSAPTLDVALPYLALPAATCCSFDGCTVCGNASRYPVVLVHGHSFSARTTPEYSLSTFTTLAFALQEEGLLYAGQSFPREDIDSIPYGELSGLPGGESFVLTYYYDSYPEEGEQSLISRKSENIETYAIRLKEAIDVVRQKTGSPKVVIVAHSMGGLVTRRYIQLFGEDATAGLVMVGTPNHGITGTTSRLCPLFGGEKECEDMDEGSVFLTKLNAGKQPSVPVYVIAGRGCENREFDGVVETSSVLLDFANNTVVNGTCPDNNNLLHSTLLDPSIHPEVYGELKGLIQQLTVPS